MDDIDATDSASKADKKMKLRYAGKCRVCGVQLQAKAEAVYEPATKSVRCVGCPTAPAVVDAEGVPAPVAERSTVDRAESGVPGASARREYERRKSRDEAVLRQKWGSFGGIAVALASERQSTKAWATGAVGEERLGGLLNSLESESIAVLHDLRIPGSRANIDHIVITTAGIWVIDAKRYRGRPELKIEGGILRPRVEKVLVGRRDCTKLVDGVLKQIEVLRDLVGEVPVTGALCFVDADWPLVGGAFASRGIHAVWPKRLVKLLTLAEGSVDVTALRAEVTRHFKSA